MLKQIIIFYIGKFISYINRILTIKDFEKEGANPIIGMGYYSLKIKDYKCEICIDFNFREGWQVSLCNKYEEVVESYRVGSERQSLILANKIYGNLIGDLLLL